MIHIGDCREVLKGLPENSVDAVVTDPPYEFGFMGKDWDSTGIACDVQMWREVRRVMKPGAHLLAFGGTRTYHRMACAVEDAGFEIRDQMQWLYGQGFPKSLDVSKAIDKAAGAKREVIGNTGRNPNRLIKFKEQDGRARNPTNEDITAPATAAAAWDGWGTALKPANEPIVVARKPLSESTVAANVLRWGTGALNIDASRVESEPRTISNYKSRGKQGGITHTGGGGHSGDEYENRTETKGRWPANVIHDGSDEVLSAFPDAPGQLADASDNPARRKTQNVYGAMSAGSVKSREGEPSQDSENEGEVGFNMKPGLRRVDRGSAARFYYCAKASKSERGEGNNHPTVKPLALISYLIRLVTPPGGVVLDPFLGSGSTAKAAVLEGFYQWIGCEKDERYAAIAEKRIAAAEKEIFGGLL